MKKKVNLKFNEMNKKQKIVFVIDWIMKGILIFLILFIASVYLVSCFKTCGDNTASAATEEPEVVEDSTFAISREVYFNWDYNEKMYFKVKGNFSKSDPLIKISLLNFPLNGLPYTVELVLNSPLTQELTVFLTGDNGVPYDRFILLAGDVNGYVTSSDTFISGLAITSYDSFTDIDLDFTFYFYVGSYVPGYGQGLAAGIQQGYHDGYNQGASDTSKQYAAGIFANASAKFGYTNSTSIDVPVTFVSDLSIDVSDYVTLSGFPDLSENYNFYYIYIRFSESFVFSNEFLIFYFANSLPLLSSSVSGLDGSVDSNQYYFGLSYSDALLNINSSSFFIPFSALYPSSSFYYLNSIASSDNDITLIGKEINNLVIRVPRSNYSNLLSMRMTTSRSDNEGYFNGFNEGYDKGFNEGNSLGYENGFNEGSSVSDDKLNASFNNGYDKGFQEGFNQNGSGGFNWLVSSVQAFLSVNFFGDFGIGTLIYVCLGAGLILMFLKMFAGG